MAFWENLRQLETFLDQKSLSANSNSIVKVKYVSHSRMAPKSMYCTLYIIDLNNIHSAVSQFRISSSHKSIKQQLLCRYIKLNI